MSQTLFDPIHARELHPGQPHRHGAAHAQPRARRRAAHHHGHLLRPARQRRPAHHRGHGHQPPGPGLCRRAGLYGTDQLDGWKKVTAAVHERGGKIVTQLCTWAASRTSRCSPKAAPRSRPSAIAAKFQDLSGGPRHGQGPLRRHLHARARASTPRAARHRARLRRRLPAMRWRRPASTAWRSTRQRLSAGPVPQDPAPTSAPTTTAAASRTAPACCWR